MRGNRPAALQKRVILSGAGGRQAGGQGAGGSGGAAGQEGQGHGRRHASQGRRGHACQDAQECDPAPPVGARMQGSHTWVVTCQTGSVLALLSLYLACSGSGHCMSSKELPCSHCLAPLVRMCDMPVCLPCAACTTDSGWGSSRVDVCVCWWAHGRRSGLRPDITSLQSSLELNSTGPLAVLLAAHGRRGGRRRGRRCGGVREGVAGRAEH